MDQREQTSLHHGKDGHGFGKTVDGGTPTLLEEKKDSGDQSSRVANTDPPHKVDDGEAPADGNIDAPDAGAPHQQVADGRLQNAKEHGGHRNNGDPENRRMPG